MERNRNCLQKWYSGRRTGALVIEFAIGIPLLLSTILLFWNVIGVTTQLDRIETAFQSESQNIAMAIDWTMVLRESVSADTIQRVNSFEDLSYDWLVLLDSDDPLKKQSLQNRLQENIYHKLVPKEKRRIQNKRLWLGKDLEVEMIWESRALWITLDMKFKTLDFTGLFSQFEVQRKLLIPCAHARAFFTEQSPQRKVIYLTPYGVNESHKYHTHYCWSLRKAKTVMEVAIPEDEEMPVGKYFWQGQWYTLCSFCQREAKDER